MKEMVAAGSGSSEPPETLERRETGADDGEGSMITLPLSRSQWAKTKGVAPPTPGVSTSSLVRLSSSVISWSRRVDCAVVLMGSAEIHRCIVVHTFGTGLPGVSCAMSTSEARLVEGDSCEGAGHVLLILAIGNVACHSPSL